MAATLGACYECPFCIEFDPVAAHIRTLGDQVESCALTHAWIDYGCRPCEGEKLAKFGAFALRQRVITHLQTRSTACHSFSFPSDRDGDNGGLRLVADGHRSVKREFAIHLLHE